MAVVNLSEKYDKKIQKAFTAGSILQGRLKAKVDFIGAKTVRIYSLLPAPLNDYNRNASDHRYGETEEVGDWVQELTMTQDKAFSRSIDKGNTIDQSINKAGEFLGVEMKEVVIPEKDKYGLNVIAQKGGVIVGSADAITKDNILARVSAARASHVNNRAPLSESVWYVTTDIVNALFGCEHFRNLEKLGVKAICTGHIGSLFGASVIEVPADLMPKNVNFILLHSRSAASPSKIDDCKMHTDAPHYRGNLVQGSFYWDTFVIGVRANGIYVDVTTGSGKATVCTAPTIAAATGVITPGSGFTSVYTRDGSDPRYSKSAVEGTTPTVTKGVVVKAYNKKDGAFNSGVVTVTVTG